TEAVDGLADLELGRAQQLGGGLGGQQLGEPSRLLEKDALQLLEQTLGFGLLVGGEIPAGTPSQSSSWMRSHSGRAYTISRPLSRCLPPAAAPHIFRLQITRVTAIMNVPANPRQRPALKNCCRARPISARLASLPEWR